MTLIGAYPIWLALAGATQLLRKLQIRRIREGKVSAYLQGRKIVIGQDSRSPPVEIVRLIRKLRWMGMEEEAEDLQAKMQEAAPIGGVITTAYETD